MQDAVSKESGEARRGTVVGSGTNVAPEMLESEESSFETDLWQLGITLFMLQTGKTPFPGATGMEMLIAGIVQYPQGSNVPQDASNLINELLKVKPHQRLGAGTYEQGRDYNFLRGSKFFEGVDFENLFAPGVDKVESGVPIKKYNKPTKKQVQKEEKQKERKTSAAPVEDLSNVAIQRKRTI